MPRFFFHLRDHENLHEDTEGMDLPDLHAALNETLRSEQELVNEPLGVEGLEFEITDSSGRTVLKVPVSGGQQSSLHSRSTYGAPSHLLLYRRRLQS